MRLGYILNIYDSLNYDIYIPNIDKMENVISEEFTFCSSHDVMDSCLYRTDHAVTTTDPVVIESDGSDMDEIKTVAASEYNIFLSTRTSSEGDIVCRGKSYRCHMKDLRFRNNSKIHHDYGISKNMLIKWTDFTNGYVFVDVFKVDVYNRLIVELYDPLTRESFKNYLINNFPTIFCYYQQPSTTVKLSELTLNRPIPRPRSFQLKDYVYHVQKRAPDEK